ncbi:hypothetical protein OG824_28030 [Streptomyces prunicolor]|uniref:hypothetical protein n=1 Tax=Streptomyces prunicolor TaxID=67348 RepID=UPI00225560AE|nr:hypothetical protein [Streptomyces prunicolor]MCX5239053.1 hypothetical protein [Streptomyces prunicolor]
MALTISTITIVFGPLSGYATATALHPDGIRASSVTLAEPLANQGVQTGKSKPRNPYSKSQAPKLSEAEIKALKNNDTRSKDFKSAKQKINKGAKFNGERNRQKRGG